VTIVDAVCATPEVLPVRPIRSVSATSVKVELSDGLLDLHRRAGVVAAPLMQRDERGLSRRRGRCRCH
jgi:hypothetical protein